MKRKFDFKFMADIVLQKSFMYIMYMYMLQIQVHKYFSDFDNIFS
jgi:hypothetical protein